MQLDPETPRLLAQQVRQRPRIAVQSHKTLAVLTSIDPRAKMPSHHHWPSDRLEHLDWGSIAGALELSRSLVARLDPT